MVGRLRVFLGATFLVTVLAVGATAPVAARSETKAIGAASCCYAAIAVENGSLAYGWSNNYSTKSGAKSRAIYECKQSATYPGRCEVFVWVQNGCAAVAYKWKNGAYRYGYAWAGTRKRAKSLAKQYAGTNSTVLVSVCTA